MINITADKQFIKKIKLSENENRPLNNGSQRTGAGRAVN